MDLIAAVRNSSLFFRKKAETQKEGRIAILVPTLHDITRKIHENFILTYKSQADRPFRTDSFDTSKPSRSIHETMKFVVSNDYDLVVSIGQSCTKAAVAYTQAHNKNIPIIGCAISHAMYNKENMPHNLVGIAGNPIKNLPQYISSLFTIKKNIQHILYIHNFRSAVRVQQKEEIHRLMLDYRSKLSSFDSSNFSKSNCAEFIRSSFPRVDTIILGRDNQSMSVSKQIIELCNYFGITLASLDSGSVVSGASIGMDSTEDTIGMVTAQTANKIMEHKCGNNPIGSVIEPQYSFRMLFNAQAIKQQGAGIDPNYLLLMNFSEHK